MPDDVAAYVADDVVDDVSFGQPVTRPDDPNIDPTRSTSQPDPVNGQPSPDPCHALPHAPTLLVEREGACVGILGQFWYLQIRIEIPYTVVYRLGMFEAFTDMKIRIEP